MNPIEKTTLNPSFALAIRATVALADLPAFFGQAFHELDDALRATGAHAVGPPFARYFTAPPAPIDVEAIIPIDARVAPSGRVAVIELSGGPAVQVLHVGPYDALGPVYEAIAQWMGANGLEPSDAPREVYLSDPGQEDPAKLLTLVVQPTRPRLAQQVTP